MNVVFYALHERGVLTGRTLYDYVAFYKYVYADYKQNSEGYHDEAAFHAQFPHGQLHRFGGYGRGGCRHSAYGTYRVGKLFGTLCDNRVED